MEDVTSTEGTFRSEARNAAIPVVIHESGGSLYLNPKPGDVTVRRGHVLTLLVVNLTNGEQVVTFEFEVPIGGTTGVPVVLRVQKQQTTTQPVEVPSDLFEPIFKANPKINVIAVGYRVKVNGNILDPDLKIQR